MPADIQLRQSQSLENPTNTTVGRVRSSCRRIRDLPDSMQSNGDSTIAIYTPFNDDGQREVYTEIPFIVFHGMQIREQQTTSDLVSAYLDMDRSHQDAGTYNMEQDLQTLKAKSFTEEIVEGKITRSLLVATLAAASLQFLVGYNVVILNTPEAFVFPGHQTFSWSVAVGALGIGAVLGSSLGGRLSDGQGRRFTLLLNVCLFLIGGCLQTFAPHLLVLTMARYIVGIASGISTVLVPTYLGELAPIHLRGALGTVNQFAYALGILGADLLSFQFATTEGGWRYLFSITILIAVFLLLLGPFVVESPRWLLQRNPKDVEARQILANLRGYSQDSYAFQSELLCYTLASNAQQQYTSHGALLVEIFAQPHVRFIFLCILFLHTIQQLSGINAVFYYSTSLLGATLDKPLVGTTMVGAVNVVFTYIALILMDSCKHKSLLLWSLGGMLGACSTLILAQSGILGRSMILLAINSYVAFYEIGVGPIPWLIIAEMVEARYVAVIMSICSQLSWIVSFLVSLTFPTMNKSLGNYTFVPFAVILLLSLSFTIFVLPETQGRPAMLGQRDLEHQTPSSKHSHCVKETQIQQQKRQLLQQQQQKVEVGVGA